MKFQVTIGSFNIGSGQFLMGAGSTTCDKFYFRISSLAHPCNTNMKIRKDQNPNNWGIFSTCYKAAISAYSLRLIVRSSLEVASKDHPLDERISTQSLPALGTMSHISVR